MKITIVCARSPRENVGGIESYVLHLSQGLKEAGYLVEIVTTAKNPKTEIKINDVSVQEFTRWAPGEAYFFSYKLYQYLKNTESDIIHANGFNNLTTLAALIAKKKKQKLVIALQSSEPSSSFRKLLRIPYTFLFNLLSKKVDHIICASHFEKRLFASKLKIPEDRFAVIPNGVDIDMIKKIKVQSKSFQIISIGRMVKNKGFDNLIQAFSLVFKKKPEAHLILVGSGPYEEKLHKMAKEMQLEKAIEFIPNIPLNQKEKLIELLKSSALFAFPSKYEGQSIIVCESIIAGIPTLVSYSSALAEFVDQNNAVGIANPDSPNEIANKILNILESPQKFKPTEANILTWAETVQKTREIYENKTDIKQSHII